MSGGFLLDPRAGWRGSPALSAGVRAGTVLRLRSDLDEPRPLADPAGTFGGLADPPGAVAGHGQAYRIDGDQVLRHDPCTGWVPLACAAGWLGRPRALALTGGGDLVVADSERRRLVVFGGGGAVVRRVIGSPAGPAPWTPWDVAVDRSGRLLVVDRTGGLVQVLSCAGRHLATWDGESADPASAPFTAPFAVAVDRAGRVYVADEGTPAARVFTPDGVLVELRETTEGLDFDPPAFAVDDGQLVLAADVPPPRPVYQGTGVFMTEALDSGLPRCAWHRVELDAAVVLGTSVTVQTLTADVALSAAEVAEVPESRWHGGQVHGRVGDQPWDCLVLSPPARYLWLRLTLRGGPAATPVVCGVRVHCPRRSSLRLLPAVYREDAASAEFTDRFLAVFDALRETVTARVDALPALLDPYAAPDGSCGEPDFLGFLAGWLGLAGDLRLPPHRRRRLVAEAHRLYRLRGTPAGIQAMLDICTGLPASVLEEFRLRRWLYLGSARLGERSAVWDDDVVQRMRLDAASYLGAAQLVGSTDPLRDPFHLHAHRFRVFVPATHDPLLRRLVERVVELARPAHTDSRVVFVEARLRVGVQAFLGVDTVIGAYPDQTRTGQSRLGSDTVLGESGPGGRADTPKRPALRVGQTTRVGTTTVLD